MPRVRCNYVGCVFLEQGYCTAAAIEIDPDEGCLTYSPEVEIPIEQAWSENKELEEDWAEAGFGSEEPEEYWLEDDEAENFSDETDLLN